MFVKQVLAHEVGTFELLATERTQPLVLRQLLRVLQNELLHLTARQQQKQVSAHTNTLHKPCFATGMRFYQLTRLPLADRVVSLLRQSTASSARSRTTLCARSRQCTHPLQRARKHLKYE